MNTTSYLLDVIAFAWFVLAIGGYRLVSEWGPWRRRSIVAAVQEQRLRWMRNMAARDNRMIDGIVLSGLSQGNAFFASTSGLAIGGLIAWSAPATRPRLPRASALRGKVLAHPVGDQGRPAHRHFRLCVLQVRLGLPASRTTRAS